MPEADELMLEIARVLEIDLQYTERVEARNTERIAAVRSAGRRAGRLLGYKITTFQNEPDVENHVRVFVVVRETPEEDRERMAERARLALSALPIPPGIGRQD
jgi:hypothetical protein